MNPNAEPVGWGGAITALAVAAIPLLNAFGASIKEEQSNAILGFLAALIAIGTLALRSQVTPVWKAEQRIDEAFVANPETDAKPQLTSKKGSTSSKGTQKVPATTSGAHV